MEKVNLLLFGDQIVEKLSSIQALVCHSKTSPAARRFLREVTDTLQLEFSALNKDEQVWEHDVHTLLGLAEDNAAQEEPNGLIATVLMCIGRLGELIVYAEEDPSILGSEKKPLEVLAYCTGLLPAATVVAAKDTSELVPLAIQIVSITFRMAFEISRRMRLVEDGLYGNWASTILGVTIEKTQKILDEFHISQNIPWPRRVAIGIVSQEWLTVVGAPSSLARLWAYSPELDNYAKVKTDTSGPIHTDYLPRMNMERILGTSPLLETTITSRARIISPGSCKRYEHTTLRSLLSEMITDIVHNVLHLKDATEECISGLVGKGEVSLTVVGPTGHLPAVRKALQDKGIKYDINQHRQHFNFEKKARGGSDLIAIVGMSGRFPGSENIEAFWEDLLNGKEQIKMIPKSRFDLDMFYDPTGEKKNSTAVQHGAFLERPGLFDARLFKISPREASQMDPVQRLLLTTSYEALEMAGYSQDATLATQSNRIATYFGQASDDWREILNNKGIDMYYVPGVARAFGPSRLNYQYKWGGGSYAIDSACATSTTAISLACSALVARECDTALAGGGSICITPSTFAGLNKSGMISTTGGCRTYHDDADGYARGEGIGVVVLKRLEDAIADNDNVLGVVRGWARAYTSTATSITHPSAKSQSRLYEEVLRQTSVQGNDISYVEMHGTGTQAGDFEEMSSVIKVMGQGRSKDNPLTVGAVKANVGHGEAAAGVTALIKTLMVMRERKVPPQPGIPFKLNRKLPPINKLHVQIAGKNTALKPTQAKDGKFKAMVNSFDASGGNTSLVIEEPPKRIAKVENPLPFHTVTLSAKTGASLKENRKRLLDYLSRNLDVKIADIAYTTTARRMHETLRVAYTASSTRDLIRSLRTDVANGAPNDPKRKITNITRVFAFTGQGSQYAGMGKDLCQHSLAFRETLFIYQEVAEAQGLPRFIELISNGQFDIAAASTVSIQLAIVAVEIAVAHLLKTWGIQPDVVIGHSLGEYAALCVAGVLSVSDTLYLVGRRAMLMEEQLTAGEYSMLAVAKDARAIQQLLSTTTSSPSLQIACINAPNSTVVSGTINDIEQLQAQLKTNETRSTLLKLPYGFHSKQIEPIIGKFEAIARAVDFHAPVIPVASTLLGVIVNVADSDVFSPSYLARQALESVNFVGALNACKSGSLANDHTQWVEIGPEPICLGLIRATLDVPSERLLSTLKSSENNWATLSSTTAKAYESGLAIYWNEYYRNFQDSLTLLHLPTYAFDEMEYWIPYSLPLPDDPSQITNSAPKLVEAPATPSVPGFPTASLQWVENEDVKGKQISVTFASRTSDPYLYKAIQGHVVNGITVCSLSIFCDMALSASQYAYARIRPTKSVPKMTLRNVDMTNALTVPKLNSEQLVRIHVSSSEDSNLAEISFNSNNNGVHTEHGTLQVVFGDSSAWKSQISQILFLLETRIESLKLQASVGKAHRLLKPVIYKLFENLVKYSQNYQGLEEVFLDSDYRDAVGTVKLPFTAGSGHFLFNPFWMDAAVHLAGFLLNGNLKYPEDIACLSTGFETLRSFEELNGNTEYTAYVSMQDTGKHGILSGDAYVFDGKTLVMAMTGIKFQKMKKFVLNTIFQSGMPSAPQQTTTLQPSRSVKPSPQTMVAPKDQELDESTSSYGTITPDSRNSSPISPIGDEETGLRVVDALLSVTAAESGYNVDDMEPDTQFSDMGIDSLMMITILAGVRRETGVEIPATFFLDHATVGEAKAALGVSIEHEVNEVSILETPKNASNFREEPIHVTKNPPLRPTKQELALVVTPPQAESQGLKSTHSSRTILLQGISSSAKPALFLLPDGNGSLTNYIQLPSLGSDLRVYGIESPFVKTPSDYTCSLGEVADKFIKVIKKQQPVGPYLLGGFSFSAIYAYEVARKLLQSDEQVNGLLLMDMAVPKYLGPDFVPTFEKIEAAGMIPKGRQTVRQKEHLLNTVRALGNSKLAPLSSDRQPKKTVLILSSSGLAAGKQQSSELARWVQGMTESPTRGWDALIGSVQVQKIDGEHFSLLKLPNVIHFGELCKTAVEQFRA